MKSIRAAAGILVLLLASGAPARASGAAVDAYLRSLVPLGFSGNAAVESDGKIELFAYGMADRERGVPMNVDTVISVGSITKQFTAAAILKLAQTQKLRVGDSIARYLPNVPPDKRSITLHELLTHTAGLQPDYGGDFEPIDRDAFVARVMAAPLASTPGSRFAYSNAGYSLLAAIVERVSGEPYEEYVRATLFLPAGMHDTGYVLPHWDPSRVAIGYARDGTRWGTIAERGWSPSGPYWNLLGNGGILSTPADMIRWSDALARGTVLDAASVKLMQTGYADEGVEPGLRYGYGWDVEATPHGTLVSHNGGNGVFAAEFMRFVDRGVTIYVASNAASVPAAALDEGLAAAAFGAPDPPMPVQELAQVPLHATLSSGSVTLPMEGESFPVIDVTVDGKGPYRFGIETGAPFVALRTRVVDDLGLKPVARGELSLYNLDSIGAPGVSFSGVRAVGLSFADPSIDGILGLNAFAGVTLSLDFPNRRVSLSTQTLPPADGKTVFQTTRIDFGYGIGMDIAGTHADAFIDTRSGTGFSVSPDFAGSMAFAAPPVTVGKAMGAAFGPTEVKAARLAGDVRFGAFTVQRPIVDVVALPPFLPAGPLIGIKTLSHFVVTLDERTGRVRFELPGGATVVAPPPGAHGID